MDSETFKYFGLIYVVSIWSAMLYTLWYWPVDRSKSVSMHVATFKKAYLLFAIVRTLALPLLILFMYGWFLPELDMPTISYILAGLIILCEPFSAWIPDIMGWKGVAHRWAAYSVAALTLPFAITIALSPNISSAARILCYFCVLFMIFFWAIFLTSKKSREFYLYYQLTYILLFDLAFLSAAYL